MRLSSYPRYISLLLLLIVFLIGGCGVQDPDYYNRMGVFLDSQGKIDEALKKYVAKTKDKTGRSW